MLNLYEVMLILDPALTPTDREARLGILREAAAAVGGSLPRIEELGEKPMQFPIKRHRQGHYTVLFVSATPDAMKEIDRRLKIKEGVIRHLILRRPTDYFEQEKARAERIAANKAEAEAKAKAKAEAEAAARAAAAPPAPPAAPAAPAPVAAPTTPAAPESAPAGTR